MKNLRAFIATQKFYYGIDKNGVLVGKMFWNGKNKKNISKILNIEEKDIKESYSIQYNQNIFYIENNKIYRNLNNKKVLQNFL